MKLLTNSRNRMKMQKFVIFVKKNLKINMLKFKNIVKLDTIAIMHHCHYAGEYRSASYSICNLRHSVPKQIPIVFLSFFKKTLITHEKITSDDKDHKKVKVLLMEKRTL